MRQLSSSSAGKHHSTSRLASCDISLLVIIAGSNAPRDSTVLIVFNVHVGDRQRYKNQYEHKAGDATASKQELKHTLFNTHSSIT